MSRCKRVTAVLLFMAALAPFILCSEALAADYRSPDAICHDAKRSQLVVCETTSKQLSIIALPDLKLKGNISLPLDPSGITIANDGSKYYVTGGGYKGTVWGINPDTGKVIDSIKTGHTPRSPALSPDGNTLYICERFNNSISFIDLKNKKRTTTVVTDREPHALVLSKDGKSLFVINLLSNTRANQPYNASLVSVIDVEKKTVTKQIKLPNGTNTLRDICLSPDGKYAYLSCVIGRYNVPPTKIDQGWIYTNGISVIDTAGKTNVGTILLDGIVRGASNPWGIDCTEDGKYLCVSHAGTHEISAIDRLHMHKKMEESKARSDTEAMTDDLSFMNGIRERIKLTGLGPRSLVCVGKKVYISQFFSDDLCEVVLDDNETGAVSLGSKKPMDQIRRGHLYFNDATLCFQAWQSCASCHPDTRSDSLNWDLLNDGIGNPKQSKSMLHSHLTPPVMALGVRDKAETAVRAGIRFILFAVRPEEEAQAIDAYLKSLTPLPSRYLVNGKMTDKALRGKKIFTRAGCIVCHPPPLFTNKKKINVGSGTGVDKDKAFDTPSLIEIWRSSPYLHDGRSVNIKDVLTKHNPLGKRGNTKDLTETELDELVTYIMSL